MSKNQAMNADVAVAAILDMASRRNLHASRFEVEHAWQEVSVERESDRLAAVWQLLFPGHRVALSPIALMSNSQLPAWVVSADGVGILTRVAVDDEPAEIDWVEGSVLPADAPKSIWRRKAAPLTVWVPMPPLVSARKKRFNVFRKRGKATQAIRLAMRAHRPVFVRAGIASLFVNSVAIVVSLFALQVYDRVVPNFATATLWFLASGVALALALSYLFQLARMRLMESSERRLDEALSQYFFNSVLQLKVDKRPQHVGTLVAQVRDYEAVKGFFTASTLFTLAELPFIGIFIALMWLIGGPVAWVPAVFAVLCLVVGLVTYLPVARAQRSAIDASVRRQGLLYEAVSGTEMIKGMGGEARFGDAWMEATRESAERTEKLRIIDTLSTNTTQLFQQLGSAGILIVGVYVIAAGNLTLGGLIACSILGGRALAATSGVTKLLLHWHHARYALKMLDDLLTTPTDDNDDRQANTRAAPLDLTMTDVSYVYGMSTTPQLVVPNLRITQGERIAVLGRNGGGKSTLLKLLSGVATPSGGQVQIAQLDMENCRPSWLRETIGYLPQDVRLFSGTLFDNLTLGLSLPAEGELLEAMEKTGLDNVLAGHADGLQLRINEGGTGLSGGQRQLVALTRLLLQKPKIWLLDEPGNGLDSETESRIMQLIADLPAECTVLFTTHKTTWLELSKRVMVLEGGQIRIDEDKDKVQAKTRADAAKETNVAKPETLGGKAEIMPKASGQE